MWTCELLVSDEHRLAYWDLLCGCPIDTESEMLTLESSAHDFFVENHSVSVMFVSLGTTLVSCRQACPLAIPNSINLDLMYSYLLSTVAGTIDSGKSTLIAVLTHGSGGRPLLDNGLGSARTNILKHKHEIESGRTSSISEQLLGYDSEGRVLNYAGVSSFTPFEIGTTASRQIHFIDMGGHEKYLKTAFYGKPLPSIYHRFSH